MEFILALQGAAAQGVLWALLCLGTYITFRLLNFPDLTVDGSFATGAAVTAILMTNGVNPFFALILATIAGALAGGITGLLHTKLKIPGVLAGILTQIALYSINLRIMGRANLPLLRFDTIFTGAENIFSAMGLNLSVDQIALIVGVIIIVLIISILYWFFGTEVGSAIRATGNNGAMVRALGQNTDTTTVIALMVSNALVGLSGALVAQYQGAADVGMGAGAIVIGLASIVIGEVLFPKVKSFWGALGAVAIGSFLYRAIVAIVLQMGMNTNDLKLLTAVIVALALGIPVMLPRKKSKIQNV
ncbi:MAG: ABC transporter permease [Gallicola sp.]|nr:ABC transporter permease [Gallicola sp.]